MTQSIAIDQLQTLNADRLHEEMQTALGDKYESMDTGVKLDKDAKDTDRKIVVRLSDDATDADKDAAAAIVDAHRPEVLSKSQTRVKERVEAHTRFIDFDFVALRAMKENEQTPIIIDLLEDIQRMMRGTDNG